MNPDAGARRLRLSTLTPTGAPPMVVAMRTMLDALVVAAPGRAMMKSIVRPGLNSGFVRHVAIVNTA